MPGLPNVLRAALLAALCCMGSRGAFGQMVLYSQDFETTGNSLPSDWATSGASQWSVSNSGTTSSGYANSSGSNYVRSGTTTGAGELTFGPVSTVGYSSISVIWGARRTAGQPSPTFEWRAGGEGAWNEVTFVDAGTTWALVNNGTPIALLAGAADVTVLEFRWNISTDGTTNYRIDDFRVLGIAASEIITTPSMPGPFCSNAASASFSVAYTSTGTFTGGEFRVQRSDPNGIFPTDASDLLVGSGASPISVTWPSGSAAGTGYRLRVIYTSDPPVFGNDNGSDITVNAAPSASFSYAGSPYCSASGTVTPSFSGTTGGTFSSSADLSITGSTGAVNTTTSTPGTYAVTYTVAAAGGCAQFQTTASITINAQPAAPDPDTYGPLCSNGAAITLGGSPAGGAWTGTGVSGSSTYAFDPSDGTQLLTYTITVNDCSNSAQTTITVNAAPNAGADANLPVCNTGSAQSLFDALEGDPDAGGTWSGPSTVVGGNYNPATMNPGEYTYTVTGVAPCTSASATVTVTESSSPDAGTNGSATVCGNDAAFSLFAQLEGNPDEGGIWSGPSTVVGGNYDPATMNPGVYTYTITVAPPCVSASSTVTITEIEPPNAGTDGALTVCSDGATVSLFAELGVAQVGGNWIGPSSVVGGNYNPATMDPGEYTYVVFGTAPCQNDSATVIVVENLATDAGTSTALTLCSNNAPVDLFGQLSETPQEGGSWTGPSVLDNGVYDPISMNPGVYTYTVVGIAPCTSSSAMVTVDEIAAPNAGTNGTLTVCSDGAAVDLFTQLGGDPDVDGTWEGQSAVVDGMYDPVTMEPGAYVYTVTGVTPCADASATVTMSEATVPDPPSVAPIFDLAPYCFGQYVEYEVSQPAPGLSYSWSCTGCEPATTNGTSTTVRWEMGGGSLSIIALQGLCASNATQLDVTVLDEPASCPDGIVFMDPQGLAVLDPHANYFQWGRIQDGAFEPAQGRTAQSTFDALNISAGLSEPFYVVRTSPYPDRCWTTTTLWCDELQALERECLFPEEGSGMAEGGLKAFPNPIGSGTLFLEAMPSLGDGPVDVLLYDSYGRMVHSERVVLAERVALKLEPAGMAPGVYLLQVNGPAATEQVKLLIP